MKWIIHLKQTAGKLILEYFQCSSCLAHSKELTRICHVCCEKMSGEMEILINGKSVDSTEKAW